MNVLGRPSKRGPRPKVDKGAQTGYRITARQRLELQVAQGFVGAGSLQAMLNEAVTAYLQSLHANADGFTEAVEKAEQHQRKQAGIRRLDERK